MNSTSHFFVFVLAAMTDSGVLLHDILGGILLAALLLIGVLLHRRQRRQVAREAGTPIASHLGSTFSRYQMWAVYWLIVAATLAFFFILPRGTSLRAQGDSPTRSGNAVNFK